ncbi:MAG: hypothetical protein H7A51_05110 [Akkermansiaceae bacterium]|nr:hypothetical protein [Akkermansiaceae bacterium]
MSNIPLEVERVRAISDSLHKKDKYWVSVKSGNFHQYTNYGGDHDEFAYMIYSDGRQMEIDLIEWLSKLESSDSCHTYTEFVDVLEIILMNKLPRYEKLYAAHKRHVTKRCEEHGAPKTWEVTIALELWDEQMTIIRNLPKLINLFKSSSTYRAENGLPIEGQSPSMSITAHSGATVSTSNVSGSGHVVIHGDSNVVTISTKNDLFNQLKKLGVGDAHITRLNAAMAEDDETRPEGDPPGKVGGSVKKWVGDITMELAQQGTAVANGVSGSLIANLIWTYFSLL